MDSKKKNREIFSYVMVRDTGFAPNPFHGVLILSKCKPVIRRVAKIGDILVGTGSTRSECWGNKLIYAAIVYDVILVKNYIAKECFTKKEEKCDCKPCPVNKCIVQKGEKCGCNLCPENQSPNGGNVLICKDFWYYGKSAKCTDCKLPAKIIKKGPGHKRIGKNEEEQKSVKEFCKWICGKKKGIHGAPIGNLTR